MPPQQLSRPNSPAMEAFEETARDQVSFRVSPDRPAGPPLILLATATAAKRAALSTRLRLSTFVFDATASIRP